MPKLKRVGGDDTEHLIKRVQDYVYLYDFKHIFYKNQKKKAEAWDAIAEELDITSEVAKKRWKGLRDNYVRYLKSVKVGGDRAASYQNWPWSKKLRFLDPNLQNSPGPGKNYKAEAMDEIGFFNNGTSESDEVTHLSQQQIIDDVKIDVDIDQDQFMTMSEDRTFPYIQNTPENPETDGIDHLFLSYAHTFRKFQPATQALMKIDLATLFAKAEMKELGEAFPQSRPSTSTS